MFIVAKFPTNASKVEGPFTSNDYKWWQLKTMLVLDIYFKDFLLIEFMLIEKFENFDSKMIVRNLVDMIYKVIILNG